MNGDDAPVFHLRNIGRAFAENRIWIDEVAVPRGRVIAIIGPSGSGKSTCLHLLGGLLRPNYHQPSDATKIEAGIPIFDAVLSSPDGGWSRYDLLQGAPREYKNRVGFVFQSPFLLQSATAVANIAVGAASASKAIDLAIISTICQSVRIDHRLLADRSRARSGGERQRIAVARALARQPTIILADEPTANLDPQLSEEIVDHLRTWSMGGHDRTLIWVTHDVHLAARFADFIITLCNGRLADWAEWPQVNPGNPGILRQWIDGRAASSVVPDQKAEMPQERSQPEPIRAPLAKKIVSPSRVWRSIGLSQVFDGSGADGLAWLRRATSMGVEQSWSLQSDVSSPPASGGTITRSPKTHISNLFRTFGAKLSTLRLGLLVAAIVVLWAQFDRLDENIRGLLYSPTLNPVVTSSRALITDSTIANLQRLLTSDRFGEPRMPNVFGRYEFDNRRVSLPRISSGTTHGEDFCRVNRYSEELQLDIAGVDSHEPMLSRIALERRLNSPQPNSLIEARFDGLWNVIVSRSAYDRIRNLLKASEIEFLCIELRGNWAMAEISGIISDAPRGRHGPYDLILSATQWRDFGRARDRDLFESTAVYFSPDPSVSREFVNLVRTRAAEVYEPPNTQLIQSLSNEAGFERISAALDRNLSAKLLLGFLAFASIAVALVVLWGFVALHFENNLRAICVMLAFGARFPAIAMIELIRLALIVLPTALFVIVLTSAFGMLYPRISGSDPTMMFTTRELIEKSSIVLTIFTAAASVIVMVTTLYWIISIRSTSLTEKLKELD